MNELAGLPMQGAGAVSPAERDVDLPALRDADPAGRAAAESATVTAEPAWFRQWQRSVQLQRELREHESMRRAAETILEL